MSEPEARRGLSELIPGSATAIQPKPVRARHYGAPVPAVRTHTHLNLRYVASCPACRRNYGPGTAVGQLARLLGLSVQDCLRHLEQRKRDNDPWVREMHEKTRQIRARLAEIQPKEGMR